MHALGTGQDVTYPCTGPVDLRGAAREQSEGVLRKITNLVQHGLVAPHVGETYPLEKAVEAIAAVAAGHRSGKIVIVP